MYSVHTRTNFYGMAQFDNGRDCSLSSSDAHKDLSLDEVCKISAFFFPGYGPVHPELTVEQHNNMCLTIRARICTTISCPDNRVLPAVDFEVVVFPDDRSVTDEDWAEIVCSLRSRGYKVKADRAPSEHFWSTGITGHGRRAVDPNSMAIERVRVTAHQS